MRVYFADLCAKIQKATSQVNCIGTYDIKYDEYILMINPFTYTGGTFGGVTVAWNEKYNQFSTFYGYNGDYLGQNGVNILSFKNGALYTHDTNSVQNNFYGQQQHSEFTFNINLEPSKVKVLEAMSQETDNNWVCSEITSPEGQSTNMQFDSNWVRKENNYYAYVKRDINTANAVGNPIITGNVLRSRTFLATLRYDKTAFSKLYAVNCYVLPSERSNR